MLFGTDSSVLRDRYGMRYLLSKFKRDPFGFIKRALYKTIIAPLRYRSGDDYDAAKYWHDRFSKYGLSIRGPGDEGLSEEQNQEMYAEAGRVFIDLCLREGVDFQNASVLEIGCGTGYYSGLLHNLGVRNYVGVDITDVLFQELKEKFPEFRFIRRDVTLAKLEGKYDLIFMIDVIEHIVVEGKFSFAMENVRDCLSENGVFIVAPIMKTSKKRLFYVRQWSLENIEERFPGYNIGDLVPFRGNQMITIRKPAQPG